MPSRLLARVKRLESQPELAPRPDLIQCGWLLPLPMDYVGEFHTVAVNRQPTVRGIEWCEFEQRPGPAPASTDGPVRSRQRDY